MKLLGLGPTFYLLVFSIFLQIFFKMVIYLFCQNQTSNTMLGVLTVVYKI